jgi:hypothetical protein
MCSPNHCKPPKPPAGGETAILQPSTLDFWRSFVPGKGLELGDLVTLVPPRFNQLTVRGVPVTRGLVTTPGRQRLPRAAAMRARSERHPAGSPTPPRPAPCCLTAV